MNSNSINIESLQLLDTIERRGSFAKAAQELNKATSAVSYGIQKLEEQLGITIFERKGRRSVLTPAGRLILDEGRLILNATNRLAQKAQELANGWEPKLRIAVESVLDYPIFFNVLASFLNQHPTIEIDICEAVLNGGWEALDLDTVDLIVGAPGPVPQQKGYRAISIGHTHLIPVISAQHPLIHLTHEPSLFNASLTQFRRIVIHDTTVNEVAISAGFTLGKQVLYVQNINQKIEAIEAGIGIGYAPHYLVKTAIKNGKLLKLNLENNTPEGFIAWKVSNKGKALKTFSQMLTSTTFNAAQKNK